LLATVSEKVKYQKLFFKWCSGCGVPFEATGNRAKWCKDCGHIERLRIWKERKMEERKRDE
jgi:rRNA maturation endonuclease Nob1